MRAALATISCLVLFGTLGCSASRGSRARPGPGGGDAGPPVVACDDPVDSDGDGIADALDGPGADADSDGDGIPDSVEAGSSGNPCAPRDSDSDGTFDFMDPDSDNDGLTDTEEVGLGTDPTNIDSDGDGVTDLGEARGTMTNPLDPASTIPDGDFFVVLPYNGDHVPRTLRFGTNITVADVFFLMDTTGSMYSEVGNVQTGMESFIIPMVRDLIRDVQFGAGGFDDFPVGSHGGGTDMPYYHLIDIVPFDQDIGSWSLSGGAFGIGEFVTSGPNGTPDIIDAVRSYPRHSGGNGCESGVEGLYQTATAEGVSWSSFGTGGSVPPKSCPSVLDEMGVRRGYPCFRPGALPIVVYVSDAPIHEPIPSDWPADTIEAGSCTYTDVPTAHTWDQALAALRAIGARLIGLSTDSIPSNPGYPATAQICNMAEATGAVRADGSPLCFQLGPSGDMITHEVVEAITQLVGGTPQDVTTRTENVPGNPDDFDATLFIKAIVPEEGYNGAASGPMPGITYRSKDETTFYEVIPGTLVDFSIDFWNDVRPPASIAQIFKAKIIVVGNGVATLDTRNAYIIVPPEGGVILI